jgi:hypothetical protein
VFVAVLAISLLTLVRGHLFFGSIYRGLDAQF